MVDVLIVDSNQLFAQTLQAGLEQAEARVRLATDAQMAVDELDQRRADIIISELLLNQNNGFTLLQHLRSYSDWQKIPVIVLTQMSLGRVNLTQEQWQQYGVIKCLNKSNLDLVQLRQVIASGTSSAARTS